MALQASRAGSRPAARVHRNSVAFSSSVVRPVKQQQQRLAPVRAIELDFSDPDTQLSIAGIVLGLVAGIGAPLWYIQRTERDEERLEELRALNRAAFKETGEYLTDEEIAKIRKPK